jgi:hypothetical protein
MRDREVYAVTSVGDLKTVTTYTYERFITLSLETNPQFYKVIITYSFCKLDRFIMVKYLYIVQKRSSLQKARLN